MKTVSPWQDRTDIEELEAAGFALPARVQAALGELVGVAQEGLLALSVGVGLGVLGELMEEEVTEIVGPKGKHDPDRTAMRHGHEAGEVTLGGRRCRSTARGCGPPMAGARFRLRTYGHFADRDPLSRLVLEQMLAGVSTRRLVRTREPVGERGDRPERSSQQVGGLPAVRCADQRASQRVDGPSA